MDKGLATIIAGTIAGLVGLLSLLFSLLSIRYQSKNQRHENDKNREHQLRIETTPRVLESIEKIWMILFKLQSGEAVTNFQLDEVIGCTVWLPPSLRTEVLEIFHKNDEISEVEAIAQLQNKLLEFVDSIKLKETDNE